MAGAVSDLLTVPEVAAELRADETTVRRYIRDGKIRACKPCGNLRVARGDLDAYLESTVVQPLEQRASAPPPRAPRSPRSRALPSSGSVRDRLKEDRQRAA